MNKREVKELISYLNSKKKPDKPDIFFTIVDLLSGAGDQKDILQNAFEFSLVEKLSSLRLLHLFFWNPKLERKKIFRILAHREATLNKIIQIISRKFECEYNQKAYHTLINFNAKTSKWPLQFGLEYQKKFGVKIKIYLSINSDEIDLKKFCSDLQLDLHLLKKEFQGKKFDTIALDLMADKNYGFKFYVLQKAEKGILYRVSKESKIVSVKKWIRFPQGLSPEVLEKSVFIKLPTFFKKFIHEKRCKIYYACSEGGKRSIYFR